MKNLRNRIYTGKTASVVMAVLFALLATFVHHIELLHPEWKAETGTPAPVSVRLPAQYFRITLLRSEYIYSAQANTGCPDIIARGAVVEPESECGGLLTAYEEGRRPLRPWRLVAVFALYLLVALLLSAYMRRDDMGRARWLRSQVGLFVLLGLLVVGTKAFLLFTPYAFTLLPLATVPMLAAMLLGKRLAFGVTLTTALLASILTHFSPQALFFFLATGLAAARPPTYRRRVLALFKSGLLTAVVALVTSLFITLLLVGTLDIYDDLRAHFAPQTSIWMAALASGVASGLLAILLLPIAAKVVDEVSRGRLLDLQDLDNPLLRRLRERAPSTWEHSRAMANLAEAAAHAIGTNAMLVRVGAYYHDVGKSCHPNFFIENQHDSENPHNALLPKDSAHAIFQHVTEGIRLLRLAGVPEDVIEFAHSHHGTSMLEYFWIKNQQEGNPEHLSEADFRYPGTVPSTKETAILMIVDAAEAAARTIEHPDKTAFEALVQRIVFAKLNQGQFDESGLSLQELRVVIATIVESLVGMYHARIKYPWQQSNGRGADNTARTATQEPPEEPQKAPEETLKAPEESPQTPAEPPKAPEEAPEVPEESPAAPQMTEETPARPSTPPPPAQVPFPPASDAPPVPAAPAPPATATPVTAPAAQATPSPRETPAPIVDTYTGPAPVDPNPGRKTPE
ncbi:MAG: HDIG domain-containing protein [Myxococcales bacterium]|nr:HDIG domain-containing protein [Myxococcales bacterium]